MDSTFNVPLPEKFPSKDRTLSVNFTCQRCCQPLKLHPSFRDLDEQALSELSVPLHPNTDREDRNSLIDAFQKQLDETSVMRKIVLPLNIADAGSDFMFVDELANLPLDNNQTLKVTAGLFNIMSDQSDVDHPLCEECTDNLLDQMDQQLRIAEDDFKEYRDYLALLKEGGEDEDLDKLKEELSKLQEAEARLEEQLHVIELKEREMKETLKTFENEFETLQREEDKRWQEFCRLQRQFLLSEDSLRSVKNQLEATKEQFDTLSKTNIFNATFHIWHNGRFGTINNFRLGRLTNVPVEWAEVNAAWGQTVLLLHSMAKKIGFSFERYRLVPYGNHSYIESLDGKSKDLPLYSFGGIRYIMDSKFDQAMCAFLDCLQQFKEKVESGDSTFCLPYDMDPVRGKIGEKKSSQPFSIKVTFNSEEHWTKALKFMLTNLKWALAWVTAKFQKET